MRSWQIMQRCLAALLFCGASGLAHADFKVWTPDAQDGARALELIGNHTPPSGQTPSLNTQNLDAEFGLGDHWITEAEIETATTIDPSGSRHPRKLQQLTWENLFVLGERGQYPVDLAWFAEWGLLRQDARSTEITTGPVLRAEWLGASHTLNILVQRAFGTDTSRTDLRLAWETRLESATWQHRTRWLVQPGFQIYADLGPVARWLPSSQRDYRAGPQIFGKWFRAGAGTLDWNAGILFGLNAATPSVTLRWQLEYEIPW
jgi:hypothetical protein